MCEIITIEQWKKALRETASRMENARFSGGDIEYESMCLKWHEIIISRTENKE